ncbi:hypothetical protein Tco_0170759, partial [Tanacetum coccineum]
MKYPTVNLIDSKNNQTKNGYIKSMVVTNTNDMVVATVLQKGFSKYLVRLNHNKAADVLKAYMGNLMSKWECGLDADGKKQNTQLGRLRK